MIGSSSYPYEILGDFIKSCAFIHDDWNPVLLESDWDQYETNPFLLGANVCVLNTLEGFGEPYIRYLRGIGCFPEHIIVPARKTNCLTNNLLTDNVALFRLRELVNQDKLDISVFYNDVQKNLKQLALELKTDFHTPRVHPSRDSFLLANDKISAREILETAGVPMPESCVCHSADDVLKFFKSSRSYKEMLIKQSHRELFCISNQEEAIAISSKLRYPLIAETRFEVMVSPVCHFISWKDKEAHLFTVRQIVNNWHHAGNEIPISIDAGTEKRITDYTRSLLNVTPSFRGIFGVDYIVTPEGQIMGVDVNPRFCSSTYPFFFLLSLGFDLNEVFARYRIIRRYVENLSAVFRQPQFIPIMPGRTEGILLFNPVVDFNTRVVRHFSYLAVATDPCGLSEIERVVNEVTERVCIG